MSLLEHETAPSATPAPSRSASAPASSTDLRLLVPLQRSGCSCGGSCASCRTGDDQDHDAPTVMRLAAATSPTPATRAPATPRRPPAGLLQLQGKAGNRAVSRLLANDTRRARPGSRATATVTAPGPVPEPSPDLDLDVAKQGHEETTAAHAAPPPPAGAPPAAPPGRPEDGARPGPAAAELPVVATAGGDGGITVARSLDSEPTLQRDDDGDGGVLGLITGRAESLVGSIRSRGRQIWAAIETMIAGLVETLTGLAQAVADRLGRTLAALQRLADSLWSSLRERIAAVGEQLQSGFDALRGRLRGLWEGIKQSASGLLETLKGEAAGLIERIQSRVVAVAGPTSSPGGNCVTSEAIDRAHAMLPGEVDAAIGEFAARATAGLTGLDGAGASAEAEGGAGSAALEGQGSGAIAAVGATASATRGQLDSRAAAMRGDADAGMDDVQAQADAAVHRGGDRLDGDADGLDQEGQSGASGLGGLLSGLASAVLGRARQVVAGVRDKVGDIVGTLRRQGGALLTRLGQRVRSILERVRSVVDRVIDSAIALLRDVVTRIESALAALRAAMERIAGLLQRLAAAARSLWSHLRSMVASGWNRLRAALASLRARAAALLPASDCTACDLRDAAQRAERLSATGLGNLDLGSVVAGLKVALKRTAGGAGPTLPAEVVVARLGRGQALAADVRGRMEGAFGRSFDGVEVHTGDAAGELAEEMGARAFTVGQHVGFGPAQYRPGTLIGDALLAHELAHVTQDSGRVAAARRTDRADRADHADHADHAVRTDDAEHADGAAEVADERDADETAVAVVTRVWSGGDRESIPIAAAVRSGLAVRRCAKCCEIQPPAGELKLVTAEHDGKPTLQSFDDAQQSKRENTKPGEESSGYSMGLTGLNVPVVKDAVNMTATPSRKCDELCEVNTERLPAFALSPFYAVRAGNYDRPGGASFPRNTKEKVPWACRGKQMKKTFRITQAIADQASAMEVEHCNDLKLGWNRSVAKWLGAVKELGSGFCTPEGKKCEQQFKELVKSRSGVDNPLSFMDCAQSVSKSRDEPDVHIFGAPRVVEVTRDCSEAIYEFPPVTKLGKPSSEELIDACGK